VPNSSARRRGAASLCAAIALVACASSPAGTRVVFGRSVDGRPLVVLTRGAAHAAVRILVVGCIHGNERAGIAIADALARLRAPARATLSIIPDLNPDGVAAHTRRNAHGVDLNRNFPYDWRPLGGVFDSGPHALSEPESSAAARFVLRFRPTISIWFHQHLDLVDESGGDAAIERRFARLVGLRLVRLPRYPGSAVGWENHVLPGSTAFVVELPARVVDPLRFARAILALAK
jgi:protein MpaA